MEPVLVTIIRPIEALTVAINGYEGTGSAKDLDFVRAKRESQGSIGWPLCHDLERFPRLHPEGIGPRLNDETKVIREPIDYGHATMHVLLLRCHDCPSPNGDTPR